MPNKEELVGVLADLGINMRDVRTFDYSDGVIQVQSVHIPFEPQTWFELINAEGSLLPACCEEVSNIREIFVNALRQNQEFSAEDMIQIGLFCKLSHHKDEFEKVDATYPSQDRTSDLERESPHPISVITHIAESLKGFISADVQTRSPKNLSDSLFQVSEFINYLGGEYLLIKPTEDTKFHMGANLKYEIAKVMPFLNKFNAFIAESFGELDGYALVKDDGILQFNSGIAIVETLDEAKEVIKCWEAFDIPTDGVEIKKCKVCPKEGFLFT